jgi:hypothetical protein
MELRKKGLPSIPGIVTSTSASEDELFCSTTSDRQFTPATPMVFATTGTTAMNVGAASADGGVSISGFGCADAPAQTTAKATSANSFTPF